MYFAIVASRFNTEITERLLTGALERFHELNFSPANYTVAWVPGAIELPLMAQQFAQQPRVNAIICLGAVIRGETDHYDYVCQQVSYGCQHVALQHNIPVIFGVLTTQTEALALARVSAHNHKGREVVDAAVEMVNALQAVSSVEVT